TAWQPDSTTMLIQISISVLKNFIATTPDGIVMFCSLFILLFLQTGFIGANKVVINPLFIFIIGFCYQFSVQSFISTPQPGLTLSWIDLIDKTATKIRCFNPGRRKLCQ